MMQKSLSSQAIASKLSVKVFDDPTTTEQQEFLRVLNPCGFGAVDLGAIDVENISREFEIDSINDDVLGYLYRVWKGTKLVGTFYQELDGQWIAQPCDNNFCGRLNTPEQAQLLIVACELINTHCFDSEQELILLDRQTFADM